MPTPELSAIAQNMIEAVRSFVGRAVVDLSQRIDAVEKLTLAIPAGDKGEPGESGPPGESIKGDKGDPGESIKGERGQPGESIQGEKGDKGDPGESIKGDPGDRGDRGDPGPAGKDADPDIIRSEIAKAVAAIPRPKDGAPGRDADMEAVSRMIGSFVDDAVAVIPAPRDGKDGASVHPDTVALLVSECVAKSIAALPPAKDGRDGKNGAPGRDAAELNPAPLDASRSYPPGAWASYCGGLLRSQRQTEPVTEDVIAAGWSVMVEGVSALVVTQGDDERSFAVAAMLTSGAKAVSEFSLPVMIYREVWRDGEYTEGDVVTYSGSAWHCQQKTSDKPGTSSAWKLMVKHGAAGKDANASDFRVAARDVVRLK